MAARHLLVAEPVPPHAYPCVTLTFVSNGSIRKVLPSGRWIMLGPGQLSISDAGMLRALEPEEPTSMTLIHIGDLLRLDQAPWLERVPGFGRLVRQHRSGPAEPLVFDLGRRALLRLMPRVNALIAARDSSPMTQLARLAELLEEVVAAVDAATAPPTGPVPMIGRVLPPRLLPSPTYSAEVRHAMLMMVDDLENAWTLESVAAAVHLSAAQLGRAFSSQIGMAPMQYLAEVRLTVFAYLLRSSDMSVAVAAQSCGFADTGYGAKRFRQRFGQTPTEYRVERLRAG